MDGSTGAAAARSVKKLTDPIRAPGGTVATRRGSTMGPMSAQATSASMRETLPRARHAVAVLDLATLRYRYGPARKTIAAFTGTGAHLATVETPRNSDDRAAAWAVLSRVQESATLVLPAPAHPLLATPDCTPAGLPEGEAALIAHRVALYNPYTAQVAYKSTPAAAVCVFADVRVDLELGGTSMSVQPVPTDRDETESRPGSVQEWALVGVDGTVWSQVFNDATSVSRAVAAHRY